MNQAIDNRKAETMRATGTRVAAGAAMAALLFGQAWAADEARKGEPPAKAAVTAQEKQEEEALLKAARERVRKEDEQKKAAVLALLPTNMQQRVAYREAAEKWDAAACRKELAGITDRKAQIDAELTQLPESIRRARADALEKNPEIKALAKEIADKQAVLKKKIDELDSVRSAEALDQALRKEQEEVEWKRQMMYYLLVKLGENPAQDGAKDSVKKADAGKVDGPKTGLK